MFYSSQEAAHLVLDAGMRLVRQGLIARTWGNISARLSSAQFLITPSGRTYDSLRADDLVVVNVEDGAYQGTIRPSSEWGVHAAAYRLRDDVGFIVHTHQFYGSVLAASEQDHPFAPCACYGAPGTKELWNAVAQSIADHPENKSFFMAKHGALCLGNDAQESFVLAERLEAESQAVFVRHVSEEEAVPPLGDSLRDGDSFFLTVEGETQRYPISGLQKTASLAARLHAAIYCGSEASCILAVSDPYTGAYSRKRCRLRSYIDDFSQLIGPDAACVRPENVARAAGKRNALLIPNMGGLAYGSTPLDAQAAAMILEKNCASALYAQSVGAAPMSMADSREQRKIYLEQYSRQITLNKK